MGNNGEDQPVTKVLDLGMPQLEMAEPVLDHVHGDRCLGRTHRGCLMVGLERKVAIERQKERPGIFRIDAGSDRDEHVGQIVGHHMQIIQEPASPARYAATRSHGSLRDL